MSPKIQLKIPDEEISKKNMPAWGEEEGYKPEFAAVRDKGGWRLPGVYDKNPEITTKFK